MKKLSLLLFFTLTVNILINAQDYKDEILMTIAGREVTLGEFERIYMKNNNDNVVQKQSVEEYLDMFINFKLKVSEAEDLGMDTTASFLNEFNSYKKQLAKPYMTNPEITERLAREAYERMKKELNGSHIMLRLDQNASPDDTLYAYNKLLEIRRRILGGEDFETVARATSDDPSAKTNGGLLGWFSVLKMVYSFENVAYITPAGEISLPFRTQYGMHIVKINDIRDALGSRLIAHIFIRAPKSMSIEEANHAKDKALALVDSLKQGADFGEIAMRHSDDRNSAVNGGKIPWLTSGQMIPVFNDALFELENPGDISEAIHSVYGWHIIKLLDKKLIGNYEDEKADILVKIKEGNRNSIADNSFIKQLKSEYNFSKNEENYRKIAKRVDTTIFEGNWTLDKIRGIEDLELFSIDKNSFSIKDFAEYMIKEQRKQSKKNLALYVNWQYDKFEKQEVLAYEENNLVNKYDDYKHILQEYHDGILLFDLTDELVWTNAVLDTAGLESYYKDHKAEYKWKKRAFAYTITVNDSSQINKVRKYSQKLLKKNKFSPEKLYASFCPNDTLNSCLTVKEGKYEKGDDLNVDATKWKKGLGKTFTINRKPSFIVIIDVENPTIKELDETRGIVTADYQKYLEEKWIEELREKYEIKVNKDLLQYINN